MSAQGGGGGADRAGNGGRGRRPQGAQGRGRGRGGDPGKRGDPVARYLTRQRNRRAVISTAIALILVLLVWMDRQGWLLYAGDDLTRYDGQAFVVQRVVDGDTLIILAPDGDAAVTRVRLWGIDAPELREPGPSDDDPWAAAAADRAKQLAEGKRVTLALEPHRVRGGYGRLLAFIHLPDGTSLNERLVIEGLATADDRWPHRHLERYDLLQMQARKEGLGIWSQQDGRDDRAPADDGEVGPMSIGGQGTGWGGARLGEGNRWERCSRIGSPLEIRGWDGRMQAGPLRMAGLHLPGGRLSRPMVHEAVVIRPRFSRWDRQPRDLRQQMIAETSAFLSWALREGRDLPRIPRRRVSEGGFTTLLRMPGAKAAMANWWNRTLDRLV